MLQGKRQSIRAVTTAAAAGLTISSPFKLVDNRVFVPVTLDGKGPYSFLLDTERIVDVVNRRHAGSATFASIEGMDHLLYIASSPKAAYNALTAATPREYGRHLSDVVVRWLCGHTHCT